MKTNHKPSDSNLIAFDVDNTLINGHSHNFLARIPVKALYSGNSLIVNGELQPGGYNSVQNKDYDINSVANMIFPFLEDHETGLKNTEAISDTFAKLLDSGNKIAITSFTQYPHVVEILLDRLNLTLTQKNSIIVVTGFPPTKAGRDDPERKNYHIKAAMKLAKINDPAKVMLVDDDPKNITKAIEAGYQTVLVPKNKTAKYLSEVIEKARAMGALTMERQQSKAPEEPLYQNLPQKQKREEPLYQNLPQKQPPSLPPKTLGTNIRKNLEERHRLQPQDIQSNIKPSVNNKPVDEELSQQSREDDNKSHKQAPGTLASVIRELYPDKDSGSIEESFRTLIKGMEELDNGDIKIPVPKDKETQQQKQMLEKILTKVGIEIDYNKGKTYITVKNVPKVKEFLNAISPKNDIPAKQIRLNVDKFINTLKDSSTKHKAPSASSTPNAKTKKEEHSL